MNTSVAEPILASWKVSEVLKRYPPLLDVLISLSPAFRPLRNPVMRRMQSRLVTVGQAAAIAGMEPAGLVRALNQAIGITTHDAAAADAVDPTRSTRAETTIEMPEPPPVEFEVDVRPLLRTGREPFTVIMQAARDVSPGHSFRLLTTFEPLPLYDVLGMRGFAHSARQIRVDDWEILFFKDEEAPASMPAPAAASVPASHQAEPVAGSQQLDWDAPNATITIDVSELVPPEPMIRILETLEGLGPGQSLLVHHVRRPIHLYPRLDELGCSHETRDLGPGRVALLIRKPVAADGERR